VSVITDMLAQVAVYWAPAAVPFDELGARQYAAAVEVACRWENTAQEIVDARGNVCTSQATVYVDSDVEVGGRLKFCALLDLDSGVDPNTEDGVLEIKQFAKTPSFDCTEYLRIAYA